MYQAAGAIIFPKMSGSATEPAAGLGKMEALIMTIVFAVTIGLMVVIVVKRQILRMLLLSKRGPHTTVGSDAPRSLAREIDAQLKKVANLRIEPRMMSEQFNKPQNDVTDSPPDQYTRSYKYRMKAMDKMTELDDLLCTIDKKYGRKKGQPVRDHLKTLQKPPHSVIRGGDDTIDKVAAMYEHARFENRDFGGLQYKKFAYLVEQLKDRVRLYVPVPGSLIVSTTSKVPTRRPASSTAVKGAPQDVETKVVSTKPATEGQEARMSDSGGVIL